MDLGWLYETEEFESAVKLTEGGNFVSSLTAQFTCGVLYMLWTDTSLDLDELGLAYDSKMKIPKGTFWYWRPENYEAGVAAQKALNAQYAPGQCWHWEAPTETLLGWHSKEQTPESVFGPTVQFDTSVTSLRSEKRRHELHMIMLPSMVQALAITAGLIEKPLYDYAVFAMAMDAATEDNIEALHDRFLGYNRDYVDAELWQARTAIWAALGESDPKKYTVSQGGTHDVSSDRLKALLQPLYRPHTTFWARVARTKSPHVDAVSSESNNRRQVWFVLDIFRSREAALASASNGSDETASSLPVPAQWTGSSPDDVRDHLRDVLVQNSLMGKPMPVIEKALKKNGLLKDSAMTPEEAMPWIAEIVG